MVDRGVDGSLKVKGYTLKLSTLLTCLQDGMTLKDLSEGYAVPVENLKEAYIWYQQNKERVWEEVKSERSRLYSTDTVCRNN